jgi:hypothetical protein
LSISIVSLVDDSNPVYTDLCVHRSPPWEKGLGDEGNLDKRYNRLDGPALKSKKGAKHTKNSQQTAENFGSVKVKYGNALGNTNRF